MDKLWLLARIVSRGCHQSETFERTVESMGDALAAIVHAWRPMPLSVTKSNRIGPAVPQMRRFEIASDQSPRSAVNVS